MFGNNVKHDANHISRPNIAELDSNMPFWSSFNSILFLFICYVYTLTLIKLQQVTTRFIGA